ncbi:long-chain-fatty-acid--CoA ligase 5-like protein [Anaeromyces robustus]|uniref:Long-chain-fatty-acid--CoA ligase 5-like protein n=1 Tax=Anaeromyces robustus TaxID=1754192 RepID=A0A1Y1XGY0_9FUNG|nr:long-chain-fatty-acid--CoA ligase 5-like protein [Anaeromyces robustus]|eukprot:ORX84997.1 long-chain-fatty-acid--CoA ligase 5-like protein [Anaeromyces robustus]
MIPDRPIEEIRDQACVIKNDNPDESDIYRSKLTPEGTPLTTVSKKGGPGYVNEDYSASTIFEMFEVGKTIGDKFLGKRANGNGPYEYITYAEAEQKRNGLGSAFIDYYKFAPKGDKMVGIYLKNSPEWLLVDEACSAYSIISVPMYDTFDKEALAYIIEHSELSLIVTSNKFLSRLLEISEQSNILKHIIVIEDEIEESYKETCQSRGITIRTFNENITYGLEHLQEHVPPKPDDVCTICYTSGTTSKPKGVIVTHKNMVGTDAAFFQLIPDPLKFNHKDTHLCYLPLAHMFERCITHAMVGYGMKIAFFSGNPKDLVKDIQEVQPVVFPAVPRVLLRIYDTINQTIEKSNIAVKTMFNVAFNQKKKLLEKGCVTRNTIWDKIVFKKIQVLLGNNLKLILSAAAPIESKVMDFFRIIFGVNVIEGYGATETSACGILTLIGDYTSPYGHHVGPPFPSLEIKLVAVPEMDYYPTDDQPRGEVCFYGTNVTKGYYKNEEETKKVFIDGWFHTGDIGVILPNKALKIIDRKKNIFKLQQGEYVAPENIESKLDNPYISQLFVYGTSLCSKLVAIVVPDQEVLAPVVKEKFGIENATLEDLCKNKDVKTLILDEIKRMAKETKLHGFEIPADICLISEPFTMENGLLTPTFKTKRNKAYLKYKTEIDNMYKALGEYKEDN